MVAGPTRLALPEHGYIYGQLLVSCCKTVCGMRTLGAMHVHVIGVCGAFVQIWNRHRDRHLGRGIAVGWVGFVCDKAGWLWPWPGSPATIVMSCFAVAGCWGAQLC